MNAEGDRSTTQPRRRWVFPLILVLLVGAATAWGVRSATWPCGALDRTSGCVQRVALDLAAVGLDAATARPEWLSFDLGAEGRVALVSAAGPGGEGWRGVLALFDAETGADTAAG
jgi:hypothetical protein